MRFALLILILSNSFSHYDIANDSLHISQSMFWPMAIEYDDASGAVFLSHNPGSGINYFMNGNFSDTLTVDGIVNKALFVPVSHDTIIDWLKERDNEELRLYPNPTSTIVHVELPGLSRFKEIRLFDISGKIILRGLVESSDNVLLIDCSKLREGYYFLKILTRDQTYSSRIVKQ